MEQDSSVSLFLVNPSDKDILENAGDRLPIGLLGMASGRKAPTKLYDLNHTSEEQFYQDVEDSRPEAVGISVYTSPLYNKALEMARRLNGKTRLIAGGYHATAMPETLSPFFDAVVRGEGESALEAAMTFNGIIDTTSSPPDLSKTPQLDYSMLDMELYGLDQHGRRTGTIITSRGCPYSCSFCGKFDRKVRYEPVSKVLEQIEKLKAEGMEAIYFLDDVFTLREDRMGEIVKGVGVPYRITTRANLATPGRLETLADTGCEIISLGVESGDDEVLKKSNKGMTAQQNRDAVINARAHGIGTKGFFILGLPGETEESAKRTIDFALELGEQGMEQADFYFLTPFPGTPIWNDPARFGINIRNKDYTKYLQAGKGAKCVVDTEELKAERIEELVEEAKQKWQDS